MKELIEKIRTKDEGVLDDIVCDIMSEKASRINNSGIDGQIAFLVRELGEEEAEREIRQALEEWP